MVSIPLIIKKSLFPSRFGVIKVGIIRFLTIMCTVSEDTGQAPFVTVQRKLFVSSARSLICEVAL